MGRYDNGWVKLYRRAMESDLGQNVYLWTIWTTLLSWATRHEQKRLIDGEQRTLPPGTVIFGITEMADRWGCSKSTVSKWLRYLVSSERITLEVRTRGCIATICNWAEYYPALSSLRTEDEQSSNEVRTPSERCANPNGELKKERREREGEILSESLSECLLTWEQSLTKLGIQKSAKLDEQEIARLIQRYGAEKTRFALAGAAFEERSENYDPTKHVSIRRLLDKPAVFDTFVNLGAKNKPVERKVSEWKIGC